MRVHILIIFLILGVICTAEYFIVSHFSKQVVDKDGKKVKGKFTTQDGVTATLQA